jgi:hypothetical protein
VRSTSAAHEFPILLYINNCVTMKDEYDSYTYAAGGRKQVKHCAVKFN